MAVVNFWVLMQGGAEADGNAPSSSAAEQPDGADDFGAQMRAAAQARRQDLGKAPEQASCPSASCVGGRVLGTHRSAYDHSSLLGTLVYSARS